MAMLVKTSNGPLPGASCNYEQCYNKSGKSYKNKKQRAANKEDHITKLGKRIKNHKIHGKQSNAYKKPMLSET